MAPQQLQFRSACWWRCICTPWARRTEWYPPRYRVLPLWQRTHQWRQRVVAQPALRRATPLLQPPVLLVLTTMACLTLARVTKLPSPTSPSSGTVTVLVHAPLLLLLLLALALTVVMVVAATASPPPPRPPAPGGVSPCGWPCLPRSWRQRGKSRASPALPASLTATCAWAARAWGPRDFAEGAAPRARDGMIWGVAEHY